MAKILLGINLEFVRHEDKPMEWGVAKAAELGYDYVEPMVHWGSLSGLMRVKFSRFSGSGLS